jgi:hypothetical protein
VTFVGCDFCLDLIAISWAAERDNSETGLGSLFLLRDPDAKGDQEWYDTRALHKQAYIMGRVRATVTGHEATTTTTSTTTTTRRATMMMTLPDISAGCFYIYKWILL